MLEAQVSWEAMITSEFHHKTLLRPSQMTVALRFNEVPWFSRLVRSTEAWTCIARYLLFICAASLLWETLHMPLYTLWNEGTPAAVAFDVLQCSTANVAIAFVSLVVAMVLAGARAWPVQDYVRVGLLACALGVGYTLFSEWLNVEVRGTWAYSDLMPVIPGLGVGLSPIAQWIFLPLIGLWWAERHLGEGRDLSLRVATSFPGKRPR